MNNYTYWKNDELQHSGVKGMKWGIRKKRESIASKKMGREERAHRNLSRKTKRLATNAVETAALASRAKYKTAESLLSGTGETGRLAINAAALATHAKYKTAAALLGMTGETGRNVVNYVSRVWQNATARPYESIKSQKATKTGYDAIKRLMG